MTAGVRQKEFVNVSKVWRIDILLADDFVLTELAGIVDVLMIANRVSVSPVFECTYRSLRGGIVRTRTGVLVETECLPEKPTADYLFVVGNSNPDNPALSVGSTVKSYTYRNAQVFLLAEAASRYISEHGDRHQALTTHWENSALLRERIGFFDAGSSLAVEDGRVVTCAGMEATLDVTLNLIGRHVSAATKMTVADIMLHERIRDFSTQQPFGGAKSTSTGDNELDQCIELMSANIEEPLPINDLVRLLEISNRSLERKFRTYLNTTPNTFYRELRLARANNLLLNTTLSVREVGLVCGFGSGFSGLYKSFFGKTPLVVRKERRAAQT
ncbi:transcriptional regulator, AraC family [Shimia gijangensis]|uniref:Transcriptional regulator, AraC family n=1 Tax=Shimia gijangensis TaxID=1470563 RepID=A0A1M6B428_9RHOB|nr:helix-turn-helix domain-containing protein [Shimia gijangensis]SHI43499.1 transcriptional regulator, AraC family [Shimia gijangensis]